MTRSRPKPWGEELWNRVSEFMDELATGPDSLLERIEDDMAEIGWESDRLQEAKTEAHAIRTAMLAEETRRAV